MAVDWILDRMVARVLGKLARHDVRNWALTGGWAFEIHGLNLGLGSSSRVLNDLDFITTAFSDIPETLAEDFLFRHVHPFATPGRTMLQLIDRDNALRIDVFRACGQTMSRAVPWDLPFQIVSLEDLIARAARLLLDLDDGVAVPSKHGRDYLRFVDSVDPAAMEAGWRDHRKPRQPATFGEAKAVLRDLIPRSASLLITPQYSQDPDEVCPLCAPTGAFQLADPKLVLSLLGYC
jgi:hypothetical protein